MWDDDSGGLGFGTHFFPQTHKKNPQVEQSTQNIYWTLEEDHRLPKRAENPSHSWIEQKEKRRERNRERRNKKESGCDQHSWEGAVKEERNSAPREGHLNNWEISQDKDGNLRPHRKAQQWHGWRITKKGELHKSLVPPPLDTTTWDAQGDLVLRLRLLRSVLGLDVWRQPEKLGGS